MDGVVVDFDSFRESTGLPGNIMKAMPGAYLSMKAYPGAIAAVRSLIGMGFEVWMATKPPTGVAHAYADKAAWVLENIPELKRNIIITHDKGMLGDESDVLIDDRPHKANCESFRGTLIHFGSEAYPGWPEVLETMRDARDAGREPGDRAYREASRTTEEGALDGL